MIGSILAGAAGVTAATVSAGLVWRRQAQREVARGLAIASPQAIVEEQFVRIGGIEQWIGIRGEDRRNPALLVLHGGPGAPFSMFTPAMRAWEREFTIVQWDQRGAGKTLGRNGKAGCGPLSFARLVADAIEVAEWTRAHLQPAPLVLLAGSMGNLIGAPLARRRPDLFAAYVATDFGVDGRNEVLSYEVTLQRLRAAGEARGVRELEAIGADPSRWDLRAWQCKQRWILRTDPRMREVGRSLLMRSILTAPGYSLRDIRDLQAGMTYSAEQLFAEFMRHDARREGTRFELPFFLFQGDDDVFTATAPAQEFFADVQAPHKEFALIRDAGHFAAFTRSEQFLQELCIRVLPRVTGAHGSRRTVVESLAAVESGVCIRLDDGRVLEGAIVEVEGDRVVFEHRPSPFHAQARGTEAMAPPPESIAIRSIAGYVDPQGRWRALPIAD
ncbi:alpha/beta fold hydrolase [Nannocystis radixulma]|uniref:Alpha/beta fold hydrolase n=1 Tax=Nannocystis radixulma TaxID=2995305 RepID=A0ABT5BJP2_9BACT|nr:alpha/beta fold hydrolase [Nannocystis radixulma]MDC0674372.1 alpha/beta fold hydrolase [Nannocystis radixulma]